MRVRQFRAQGFAREHVDCELTPRADSNRIPTFDRQERRSIQTFAAGITRGRRTPQNKYIHVSTSSNTDASLVTNLDCADFCC